MNFLFKRATFERATVAIRAAAIAFLMAAALPVAAQTVSTKFIPTFLVYYGGGPALVASDAAKLAKFDLIDIDRSRYNNIGSNTWAAIKAINPNVQIYLYQMGPEAPSHLDGAAQVSLNGLGRHNVSRGHPQGSLNGNNPGLFQLDASGRRIYSLYTSNPAANQYWYLMDFGSAAYQSYWLNAANADIVNKPWVADGVFADNCLKSAGVGRYSSTPAWYSTNATWSAAMNSFAGAITAGLHGVGQKLWCNTGYTMTSDGSNAWLALDGNANPPDVLLEENAFAVQWGNAHTQFYSETEWKRQIDTMGAIKNSKVAMLSHTKLLEGQAGTDNFGKSVTYWQTLWYSLGSFLLGKNDLRNNAHFMFSGGSGYNKIWWHNEYDKIDLGKAIGPYSVMTIGSAKVYWRQFEKGYVYVNPSPSNATSVSLPQASKRLTHDNLLSPLSSIANVTTIALQSHDAAILLKSDTTAPSVPTGLRSTAVSATQINLTWNASTDNVGVTGYRVYRGGAFITALGNVTTYQNTGLSASTTYAYTVRAVDAAGNRSAHSAAASVTTQAASDTTPPSVPAGLTGAAVSASQINLAWSASTDNVAVSGYRVERCQGAGCVNFAQVGTPIGMSFSDIGLAAGTNYIYRVRAADAASNLSGYSNVASATTPSAPPPAAGLVAAYAFNEGAGTTVADVSGNGNNGISSGASWTTAGRFGNALVFNGTNALVTVPNSTSLQLTTGMTLEAWVNPSVVTSRWRDVIYKHDDNYYLEATSPNAGRPGAGGTFYGSPLYGTAALPVNTWTHLALSYDRVTLRLYVNGVQVSSLAATGALATSTNPLTIGGDTPYGLYFQGMIDEVRVYNRALTPTEIQTDMNTPVGGTPPPPDTTAPTVPTGLSATAASANQINLAWSASTDNVAVTGYRVYRGGALITTLGNVTTYQNTGLTASTAYTYTVRAIDAAGNASAQSAATSTTTQASSDTTPPSVPAGLTGTAVSASQINLAWSTSTDNVAVTGYRVYRGGVLITTLGNVTTYQNTGLTASTAYTYTVQAIDAAGNVSAQSTAANATTQAASDTTAPSIPIGLTGTAVSATQINLAWNASTDNVAVTGYRVERCQGAGCVNFAQIGTPIGTSFSNLGLAAGTSYRYRVRTTDAAGNLSGYSTVMSATTPSAPPAGTATLAWDAVTAANLSGYRIYYGTAPGTYLQPLGQGVNVGNATTYAVTGLSGGIRYYFVVTAFDTSNNESAFSNQVFKDIP